ncbi:hypothetical protein [Klebsiella quasipneumoniae]|uniref:hypothetical protein n=1 Tax=Klebsiella quasipneumoniae TaxID=1463165 RepID=UPI003D81C4BD
MNNDGLTLNQLAERNAALVTEVEKLRAERDQLAAENVALKEAIPQLKNIDYQNESMDDVTLAEEIGFNAAVMAMHRWAPKTPATDLIVAGIKADGVEEFIGRLQQHVDEGDFVGDEVAVIVGAIDCGKEFCEQLREEADK